MPPVNATCWRRRLELDCVVCYFRPFRAEVCVRACLPGGGGERSPAG
jgi:hypothetical protein